MYKWLLCLILSSTLHAAPIDDLTRLGQGKMKVLFWSLYQAELYGETAYSSPNQSPLALKITYLKNINKDDLVDATASQWEHINLTHPERKNWLTQLAKLWPDINDGDTITLLVTQTGQSHFYYNNQLLGKITDQDFGPAFLSIWLSEKTSRPKLRKALIGASS